MNKMEKQEACQLFIEQEIESGLAKGKTKYAIGKEIAEWIEKLFGAEIKPNTLEQRAHRYEEKLLTNVSNLDLKNLTGPQKQIIELYEQSKKVKKEELKKRHEEKRTKPLPTGKYHVIYADPPWSFDNSGINIAAEKQYPTMSLREICNLDIHSLCDPTTVLFLWSVASQLPEAIEVSKSWGFPNIKTCMVWVKNKSSFGGWWLQTRHEILLICAKNDTPQPAIKIDSVVEAPSGRHSEKPGIFYRLIEQMYNAPYIELFARSERIGWDIWGNEIE